MDTPLATTVQPDPQTDGASACASAGLTVYYNSACPVCDAGIRSQQQRQADTRIEWIDVHAQPQAVAALGSALEAVRERLHVRDANGRLHIGSDALATLWEHTPGQGRLAWLVRRTALLSRPAYVLFAQLLYRWNRWRGHW